MENEGKLKRVMNVRTCSIIQKCRKRINFFVLKINCGTASYVNISTWWLKRKMANYER
ncbi:hypothetical protein C5S31_07785 [ANME-1 cluster archaeon GoMg2]|nr:hypothetical protein [ANME-1 cluster archaeon GoMg2]